MNPFILIPFFIYNYCCAYYDTLSGFFSSLDFSNMAGSSIQLF